jgi:hypothetical protein
MPRFMPTERQAACSAYGTDFAGRGKQLRRLAADDREILILGGGGVLRRRQLHHLAFGDGRRGRRQDIQGTQRADLDHHAEGLPEQEVADQNARLVAPQHPRRQLAAPHLAFVYDVVVQQRRRVHELDGGRELDVTVAGVARKLRHPERQHRPQPLAARRDQVVGHLRDHGHFRAGAGEDRGVDALHVRRDQRNELVDRRVGTAFKGNDNGHAFLRAFCTANIETAGAGGKAAKVQGAADNLSPSRYFRTRFSRPAREPRPAIWSAVRA